MGRWASVQTLEVFLSLRTALAIEGAAVPGAGLQ